MVTIVKKEKYFYFLSKFRNQAEETTQILLQTDAHLFNLFS